MFEKKYLLNNFRCNNDGESFEKNDLSIIQKLKKSKFDKIYY